MSGGGVKVQGSVDPLAQMAANLQPPWAERLSRLAPQNGAVYKCMYCGITAKKDASGKCIGCGARQAS